MINKVAKDMGLKPEELIQQELDQDMADVEVWIERASMAKQ